VQVAELETILSPEDLNKRTHLHCLACRCRLASAVLANRFNEDGSQEMTLSVSSLLADLRDFQQTREVLSLMCSCNTRSSYHLV
jgi:hypothetical protein